MKNNEIPHVETIGALFKKIWRLTLAITVVHATLLSLMAYGWYKSLDHPVYVITPDEDFVGRRQKLVEKNIRVDSELINFGISFTQYIFNNTCDSYVKNFNTALTLMTPEAGVQMVKDLKKYNFEEHFLKCDSVSHTTIRQAYCPKPTESENAKIIIVVFSWDVYNGIGVENPQHADCMFMLEVNVVSRSVSNPFGIVVQKYQLLDSRTEEYKANLKKPVNESTEKILP